MDALVLFSKYPEPGKVKTRLALHIGFAHAAEFCKCLLFDLLKTHADQPYDLILAYTPSSRSKDFRRLFKAPTFYEQEGPDIGRKVHHAFQHFLKKYDRVLVAATDTPDLTPSLVKQAFSTLGRVDLVLGPTYEGSNYLIGMKKPLDLFKGVHGYSSEILADIIHLLKKKRISHALIDRKVQVTDIDSLRKIRKSLSVRHTPRTAAFLKTLPRF